MISKELKNNAKAFLKKSTKEESPLEVALLLVTMINSLIISQKLDKDNVNFIKNSISDYDE